MKLSKLEREEIRMMFGGKCAYCGCVLPEKGWQADQVDPVVRSYDYGKCIKSQSGHMRFENYGDGKKKIRGFDNPDGERKENLWPSCRPCNINKSSMPLKVWRKFLMDGPESLASYNGRFRHMLRFQIVTINPEPFKFYFEQQV